MAKTNLERQKAYKQRQKAEKKRLDLMITVEDMALFKANAKKSEMTQVEYFSALLKK